MSTTQQQVPKLSFFTVFILTCLAIVAPFVIVHNYQPFIKQKQTAVKQYFETLNPPTYNASNFITFENAQVKYYRGYNYIGDIDSKSGLRFTLNRDSKTTAKLSIKYKSDISGGILKVNDDIQYIYFPSTNWNWRNKDVIVQLEQGENNIEFRGGWLTGYAPDMAEIKVAFDNNIKKDDIVGVWKGTYIENGTKGNGNLTLTINDDMTGVFETAITGRKSRAQSLKTSFTVTVTRSNDSYHVAGKEWVIQAPRDYEKDELNGTISNNIFSGTNFRLDKVAATIRSTENDIVGVWKGSSSN